MGVGSLAALALTSPPASRADEPIYRTGHADIGPTFVPGPNVFELHYRFGSDVTTTDGTSLKNSDQAPTAIATRIPNPPFARPEAAVWDFTGVAAEAPLWYTPQTQSSGRPFLGFATDDLDPSEYSGSIVWSLETIVAAPHDGHVSLWQSDFFGNPTFKFASADGIDDEDFFLQGAGGHDHYNWGFSRPGVYEIELAATANRIGLGPVTGSGVFTFFVGLVDGDYNRDGTVDAADFTVWRNTLNTVGSGLPADGNNNQAVDAGDYLVWKSNYGHSSPTTAGSGAGGIAVVTEPASLASLLSVFALAGMGRRLRSSSFRSYLGDLLMIRNWIASLLIALAAFVAPSAAAGIWTVGHGDIGLAYEEGELFLHHHLENATVDGAHVEDEEFEPEDIIAYVPDDTVPRPAGATWDFTGNAASEPLWYIDQTQLPDRPWPGIGTEELAAEDFVGNLSFTLTGFSGPGDLSLLTFGPFGDPTLYFQTSDGISPADAIHVPTGTHAHFGWLFTAPGVYTLDITATGTLSPAAGGGSVSDFGTFTFWVAVPEPGTIAIGIVGIAMIFARRRSSRGA